MKIFYSIPLSSGYKSVDLIPSDRKRFVLIVQRLQFQDNRIESNVSGAPFEKAFTFST